MMTTVLTICACTLVTLCGIYFLLLFARKRREIEQYRMALASCQMELTICQEANLSLQEAACNLCMQAEKVTESWDVLAPQLVNLCTQAEKVSESWDVLASQLVNQTAASTVALMFATYARDHWKTYAIALEVLCECCAEVDASGAENARRVVQDEREILRFIGEYDDQLYHA